MFLESIQIRPNSTREEYWILGYDGEATSEIEKLDCGDVNIVNIDANDLSALAIHRSLA